MSSNPIRLDQTRRHQRITLAASTFDTHTHVLVKLISQSDNQMFAGASSIDIENHNHAGITRHTAASDFGRITSARLQLLPLLIDSN